MTIRMLLRCAIASSALLAFSGCATTETEREAEAATTDSPLIISNSYWRLTQLGEEPIDNPASGREIQFSMDYLEKKIAGYAGCNQFFGHYEMSGDAIRFDEIGSTRMFCEGCMDFEQKFLSMLGKVASWKIDDETLQLFDASGNAIATFEGDLAKLSWGVFRLVD